MATYSAAKSRPKSLTTALEDCTAMVDGDLRDIATAASIAYYGEARASTMPPIATPVNPMYRYLSIMSRCLDHAAVAGADPALLALFRDSSSRPAKEDLAGIGYAPLPTSLLEGDGESPGLRRVLDYYCAANVAGCSIEYAPRSGRLYPVPIPASDLPVIVYADDDPTVIVRIEWDCSLPVDGVKRNARKVWDISNEADPVFRIVAGSRDITDQFPGEEEKHGAGYPWRYTPDAKYPEGRPFIPIIVWGRQSDVWRLSWLSDAVKQDLVKRLAVTQVYIDCGDPGRNVVGATTATTTTSGGPPQGGGNRGDVRVWTLDQNNPEKFEHWEWQPGGDPVAMTQGIHLDETDMLSQLGVPVELSATGGEPLAEEIRRQREASQRPADAFRGGLYVFFRRAAALANRMELTPAPVAEAGFSFLLGFEVEAALEAAKQKAAAKAAKEQVDASRSEADEGAEDADGDQGAEARGPGAVGKPGGTAT